VSRIARRRSRGQPQAVHGTAADQPDGDGGGPGGQAGTRPAATPGRHVGAISALSGFREPIVVILLLIAFFTAVSGRPVDGVLLVVVAVSLAWDSARSRRAGPRASDPAPAFAEPAAPPADGPWPAGRRPGLRRLPLVTAGLGFGVLYAAVAGSFTRYSWPATTAVIGLATVVVVTGWRGPLRHRPVPGQLPLPGSALWAGLLAAGGLWELASLLQQPSLTATSYAHPTISALTDPLLASHAGRSVAIGIWLVIGWFLVER
jgi:hypothetical protein